MEQSLILNLNPPPSETFYVSNGVFLRENEPVLLFFFLWEAARPHPFSSSSTVFWQFVEKKEEIERYKQKVA